MDEKRKAEGVKVLGIIAAIFTGIKIIGLILLALLLILLVIIALCLFVPFAYRFRVKYIAGKFSLQGEISFLFKLIYAKVLYENALSYDLRVAFYTLASSEEKPEKKKIKPKKKARIKERTKEEAILEKKSEVNKESVPEEKILIDEKEESKTAEKKIKKEKKKFNIISKIRQIAEKIKAKWKSFKDRFQSFNIKKDAIIRFLNSDGTLSGAAYLLTQGKRLLKMVFPKKIKGWLRFGTGDVYTEGQYLSYLCLLYPLYGGKFEIEPEWDEEVFETDLAFSGRITMFIILLVALKVLFNKKVKLLRSNYNRCKRSMAKS